MCENGDKGEEKKVKIEGEIKEQKKEEVRKKGIRKVKKEEV